MILSSRVSLSELTNPDATAIVDNNAAANVTAGLAANATDIAAGNATNVNAGKGKGKAKGKGKGKGKAKAKNNAAGAANSQLLQEAAAALQAVDPQQAGAGLDLGNLLTGIKNKKRFAAFRA